MNYKLIGDNDRFNPIEQVLKNRGVEDVDRFLKARNNIKETNHYSKLDNIDEAANLLLKHVGGDSRVFVQVDPDV